MPAIQSNDIKMNSAFTLVPAQRNGKRHPGVIAWEQVPPIGENTRYSADGPVV